MWHRCFPVLCLNTLIDVRDRLINIILIEAVAETSVTAIRVTL